MVVWVTCGSRVSLPYYVRQYSVHQQFIFIVSQHIVFGITAILAWIIPDVPKEVSNQIKERKLLAREALRSADQPETGSPVPPREDATVEDDML